MIENQDLDWLKKWSLYSPENPALTDWQNQETYTYQDCFKISNGLVPYLKSLNIQRGDRVAVFSQNRIEIVFLFFALQRLGAILVPVNFRFTAPEADFILTDSGAKHLFFSSAFSQVVAQLKKSVAKTNMDELKKASQNARSEAAQFPFLSEYEKPCKILYTSGTSGFPKGVEITPKIMFWNSINTSISLDITSQDKTVNFSPLFHTGGWHVLLTPFIHRGAHVIFMENFSAENVLKTIEKEKITLMFGVPTTLSMMASSEVFNDINLGSLRYAIVGGEPMPLPMIKTWHQKGVAVRQGFGLTECGPNCFSLNEKEAETKLGSIGRPNYYVQTRVVNSDNLDVAPGEVGELFLKGPMCMENYWNNPEATKNTLVDGWLKTGDLVKYDEQQFFYVVGRKKEMFISGGENVYPVEIEKVLGQHPSIEEVAVIGMKDPQWGEVGKAFVVTKKSQTLSEKELREFCDPQMARYKIPKNFEFLDELPKGATGKILKKNLMEKINHSSSIKELR